jgi:hypothetical protein
MRTNLLYSSLSIQVYVATINDMIGEDKGNMRVGEYGQTA